GASGVDNASADIVADLVSRFGGDCHAAIAGAFLRDALSVLARDRRGDWQRASHRDRRVLRDARRFDSGSVLAAGTARYSRQRVVMPSVLQSGSCLNAIAGTAPSLCLAAFPHAKPFHTFAALIINADQIEPIGRRNRTTLLPVACLQ